MEKVYVAKLGKTVGLKGWQKLYIDSDFPEQFSKGNHLFTDRGQELTIESYNPNNDTIKFIAIDTIEEAKKLTNRQLFVTIEDTKKSCSLERNQFFWFDIIDCIVKEKDEVLGRVIDIQRLPLCDYMVIKTSQTLQQNSSIKLASSFMLPYTKDFVLDVDIEQKQIVVKNGKDILEAS